MLSKLILTAALSVAAVAGIASVPAAVSAAPLHGRGDRHDHGRFEVLVLHRGHWDCQGTYRERGDALRAARQLRQRGFEVKVERN